MKSLYLCLLAPSFLLTQSASAALLYSIETDASGTFVNNAGAPDTASWSGDGTVVGAAGWDHPSGSALLTGFTSGTLQPGSMATFTGSPAVGGVGNRDFNTGVTMTMDIDLGSGSGDMSLNVTSTSGNLWTNGFAINNIKGADCVEVEFNWSAPLAANFNSAPAGNAPFLAAFRGTGAEVTATYIGLSHTTATTATPAPTFTSGLPAGATAVDLSNSDSTWGTDGATTNWTYNSPAGHWQGINGFDLNGGSYVGGVQNSGTLEDAEQVYATGIRYTLKPTGGGTFADGSSFIFSTNGGQWTETVEAAEAVPEPSSALLLGLAISSFMMHRRKS